MTDIRVLVVDDHAVVRSGLRLLLEREPGIVPVDEAANAEEAVFRMIEHKPDVLLIDAVKDYVSLGEIADVYRQTFGLYREPIIF
jgi:DNA-binding NarL/FixJ family response regulator